MNEFEEILTEEVDIEDEQLESLPLSCANCIWRVDGDKSYEQCSGQCEEIKK